MFGYKCSTEDRTNGGLETNVHGRDKDGDAEKSAYYRHGAKALQKCWYTTDSNGHPLPDDGPCNGWLLKLAEPADVACQQK